MKQLLYILLLAPIICIMSCSSGDDGLSPIIPQSSGSWEKTFYKGDGRSVQQTNDGGYIMTCDNVGEDTTSILKTDESGNELWSRFYSNSRKFNSIQQTSDGGFIIAGSTNGTPSMVLIKTDEYGYEIWRQTFNEINDASAKSVQQTSDGGYIICGSKYQEATGGGSGIANYDVMLIKVNHSGQKIWSKYCWI